MHCLRRVITINTMEHLMDKGIHLEATFQIAAENPSATLT